METASAMPANRREQAAWRREQIIDAAMSVFGDKGVDAASMKQVATAAGVTQGLLYHYFTGKESLVLAVIAERGLLPELRRLLSGSERRRAEVVLPEVLAGFARMIEARAPLMAMLWAGAMTNPRIRAGLQEIIDEGHQLLAEYLAGRVAAGELREHDTRTAVQMLLAPCVLGQVIGRPLDPESVTSVVLQGLAVDRDHACRSSDRSP
ncbi:MAG: TetR/AcrR family transcriptional regulator [Pseudonocardiales bacterium]|nr:TetR/AcrR family transcriptional regulator [Pseudonocardiales bacterium]